MFIEVCRLVLTTLVLLGIIAHSLNFAVYNAADFVGLLEDLIYVHFLSLRFPSFFLHPWISPTSFFLSVGTVPDLHVLSRLTFPLYSQISSESTHNLLLSAYIYALGEAIWVLFSIPNRPLVVGAPEERTRRRRLTKPNGLPKLTPHAV